MANTKVGGNQLRLSTVHRMSGTLATAGTETALENVANQGLVLTGSVFLLAAPSEDLEAATKQYVDSATGTTSVDARQVVFGHPSGTGFDSYTGLWVEGDTAATPSLHLSGAMSIGTTAAKATTLTADTSSSISLDAGAISNFSTSAGDLTVDATAGSLNLTGGEADAAAVRIQADHANGGIDIDAGTAGIAVDTTSGGAITVNATGAQLQLKTTTSGELDITSAGILDMQGTTVTLDASATVAVKGATGASFGDDTGTWEFDGSGALSETGMTTFSVTPSSTLTMQGGGVSKYGDDTATWDFDGDGAVTETGMTSLAATPTGAITLTAGATSIWSTAPGADLTIDAGGVLTLDSDGADAVNIGTEAAVAKTITIGADASAKVDVNALIIELDSAGTVVLDSTTAMSLDSATTLSLDSADDSNFTVTGAAKSLSLAVVGGGDQSIVINSAGAVTNAIDIDASAGGIDVDCGATFVVTAGAFATLNGASGVHLQQNGTSVISIDSSKNVKSLALTNEISGSTSNTFGVGVDFTDSGQHKFQHGGLNLITLDASNGLSFGGAGSVGIPANFSGATGVLMPSNFWLTGSATADGTATGFEIGSSIAASMSADNDAVKVYLNGIRQLAGSGADYMLSSSADTTQRYVDFNTAPVSGDVVLFDYSRRA